MERLVPSATAVLALAVAFDCRVEDLFSFASDSDGEPKWAWEPKVDPCRYWHAAVHGQTLIYPIEATAVPRRHHGVFREKRFERRGDVAAADVLVVASCDPALDLLAEEYQRQSGFQMLGLQRTSRDALSLLANGLVHAAAVHLEPRGHDGANAAAVASVISGSVCMLRTAFWQEGLALAPGVQVRNVKQAIEGRFRWVGREPGSAACDLQREILPNCKPKGVASSHRGVAEALRGGWADVGVCVRLASEEAELGFLPLREENCEICFLSKSRSDPRLQALIETAQSVSYRNLLNDLPGYDASEIGILNVVEAK
jgi:molybdate-binding protein